MSEDRLTAIEQEIKDIKRVLPMIIKLEKIITEIKRLLDMITQLEKKIKRA